MTDSEDMDRNRDVRTVSLPGPPTYDQVVELLERVAAEPYRDSWGRTPEEIKEAGASVGYHKRPREYMQGRGMGLPYNTHMPSHFTARYGMRHEPGLMVGVYRDTPAEMMRHEAKESAARRTLRLLSADHLLSDESSG